MDEDGVMLLRVYNFVLTLKMEVSFNAITDDLWNLCS